MIDKRKESSSLRDANSSGNLDVGGAATAMASSYSLIKHLKMIFA